MTRQKSAKPESGQATGSKSRLKPGSVRLTIDIPRELDFRLDGLARLKGYPKNQFAAKLLSQGCASFNADKALQAIFAANQGETESAA